MRSDHGNQEQEDEPDDVIEVAEIKNVELDEEEKKKLEEEAQKKSRSIEPSEEDVRHKVIQSIVEAFEECGDAPSHEMLFSSYGSLMNHWDPFATMIGFSCATRKIECSSI